MQSPKASVCVCVCCCLQDDEIYYYNAKDNVSVLFYPPAYLLSCYLGPNTHTGHTHDRLMWFWNTEPSCRRLLLHLLDFPVPSLLSFFSPPHSDLIFPTLGFCHRFGLLPQSLPLLQASYVASSSSSLLPPSLRWRGFCHVFPLIDRWDVWAGYTVALLGSNCSLSLSLHPPSPLLILSPPHASLPRYPALFPPYLITLFSVHLPVCGVLVDVNWWTRCRSYKSPQGV